MVEERSIEKLLCRKLTESRAVRIVQLSCPRIGEDIQIELFRLKNKCSRREEQRLRILSDMRETRSKRDTGAMK